MAITIIDYDTGNLKSLQNALTFLGVKSVLCSSPQILKKAEKIILPGVGAFGFAMRNLQQKGFAQVLKEKVMFGSPILGICLGMQLLFSVSEEDRKCKGLNFISGKVKKLKGNFKVPHTGWNNIEVVKESILLKKLPPKAFAYFVHSYICVPDDPTLVVGVTEYGQRFCSTIENNNIFGTQFHPEKSQEVGLQILRNFAEI